MSKRVICITLIFIFLFTLSSCNSKQTYVKQDTINLNYNNISAGSGCWMGNNFICSTEHNFSFDLYVTNTKGKHKITTLSYSYDAHVYNDKLFYCDDGILSGFEFFEYDLATGKSQKIATISAERIYEYYIVNDILYVEVGDDDTLVKDIVAILLDNGKRLTVAKNISVCGIVNNELNYIYQKDSKCSIYKYNADNEKSILIGEFKLKHKIYSSILDGANFNSEYVAFVYRNEETAESKIYVYKYDDDTLINYDFKGMISEFISYDKFAFFKADGNTDDNPTEIIYRFNFNDSSTEKIIELPGYNSLFVGSDDDVYVSSTGFDGIRRYSVDGKYEDVILD